MRRFLRLTNLILSLFFMAQAVKAQDVCFPQNDGDKARYAVQIDFKQAYISGVGILACQEEKIVGSVFNEFGVSALAFSYHPQKDKVKIISVIHQLNKWYIKRILKKDIRNLIAVLKDGGTSYKDEKYHITYTFTPLSTQDEVTE